MEMHIISRPEIVEVAEEMQGSGSEQSFTVSSAIFCEVIAAVGSPYEFQFWILFFNGKIGLLESSLLGLKNVIYVLVKKGS